MLIRALEADDFEDVLALFEQVAAERLWIGTEPGFDRDRYRAGWGRVLAGEWGAAFVGSARAPVTAYQPLGLPAQRARAAPLPQRRQTGEVWDTILMVKPL